MPPNKLINDTLKFSEVDNDLYSVRWFIANIYACRCCKRKMLVAHRIVAERMIGRELVSGEVIDHLNGDPRDNRRENLAVVTQHKNTQNRHDRGTLRGVTWHKKAGKWAAQVGYNYKHIHAGLFDTREAAAEAARLKRIELGFHGEQ